MSGVCRWPSTGRCYLSSLIPSPIESAGARVRLSLPLATGAVEAGRVVSGKEERAPACEGVRIAGARWSARVC